MKFTFRLLLGLIVILNLTLCFASIPKNQNQPSIEKILSQKGNDKFSDLKRLGPTVYQELRKITFDTNRGLNLRWSALMAMAHLGERDALPEIKQALNNKDWFLRDAALRVLPAIDRDEAYRSAVSKLADPALVVRATAVDVLGELKDVRCTDKLWAQLYSKNNYIRHQSLWIRRHIVEVLSTLAPDGSENRFLKVLDDADSTLFAPAIAGLERITKKKLGADSVPPVYRRYYWKKWSKENLRKS